MIVTKIKEKIKDNDTAIKALDNLIVNISYCAPEIAPNNFWCGQGNWPVLYTIMITYFKDYEKHKELLELYNSFYLQYKNNGFKF